ncbi:hypothetical protein ABIF68_008549 [Bradyrhizobium japonicum]
MYSQVGSTSATWTTVLNTLYSRPFVFGSVVIE